MAKEQTRTAGRWDKHWRCHDHDSIPNSKIKFAETVLEPILESLRNGNEISLVDVGCGNGVHVEVIERFLESQPEAKERFSGVAIDLSPEALEATRRRVSSGRWSFTVGDATSLELSSGSFDVVLSIGIICLCDEPRQAILEAIRLAKPDGRIAIYSNTDASQVTRLGLGMLRLVGNRFGHPTRQAIAWATAPIIGRLNPGSGVSKADGGLASSREIASTNLASPITNFLDVRDIRSWIQETGATIDFEVPEHPFTAWCQAPQAPRA